MLRSITPTMTFLNRSIAFALGLIVSSPLSANPQGLDVVSGTVGVTTPNGQTLEITNSPGAILNWQGFDIGVGEITRFIQQSASSLVLNRVVTQNSSEIFGQLSSNGGVFLINPAGILIGRDAQIDTASLVMSTLDIKDGDFTAGRYKFEGDSTSGTITNHGYIKSAPNGEIILIAPSIINAPQEGNEQSGLIESEGGDLILAAGFGITISSLDDPNVSFEVQAPENEVINLGRLLARGGTASVLAGTIKHSGEINADSLSVDELGRVVLIASSRIETSADSVISARGETLTNDEIDLAAVAPDADVLIRINPLGADGGEVIIRAAATPNTDEQAIITISDTQIELAGRIDVTGYTGGNTSIEADAVALSSIIDASGNNTGGTVHVLGDDVSLTAATITANSGIGAGGQIRIGGDYQGAEALRAAATTTVDATSQVQANAGEDGLGGTVIIWSDEETIFSGQAAARGGANSGDGGLVEVSGKETLRFSGAVDVGAPAGQGGTLLLDPQRIFIIPGGVSVSADNPSPFAGDGFGSSFQVLTNGNILVQNQNADISGAMDAGQITVLDSFGTVLGTLNGTTADQRLGAFGFLNLAGNLLIRDRNASNGAAAMAGALILLDPTTGQEIGRTLGGSAGEQFGANLLAFSGDNALFRSTSADISGIGADVGLVSLISGTTGLELGRITGQSANENFGTLFTSLGTTFVVRSPTADVAGNIDAGAVVLGNLTTGNEVGRVNGGAAGDMLGQTVDFFGTPSGSYLIRASLADTGGLTDNGTAILVSRTTGMELGRASGLADDDHLGSFAAISTGPNYFLRVPEADFGIMTDAGSLVLVNGATGARIGAADGGANNDFFSQNGIESLGANIAVVINELADTAGGIDSGSVVAVNLSTGAIAGRVDGTSANEMLGSDGIVTRSNGNYFIPSPLADTGGGSNVDGGSVILADGNTGNALAQFDGDTVGEQFGANRLDFSLANDDIIVFDPDHGSGAGIVTQLASSELSPGVIERGSVMGGGTGDGVGSTAPIFLAGGNYVVASPNMNAAAGSVSVIDDATAAPVFASIDGLNSGEQVGALLDFATFGFGDKFAIRAPNYNPGNGEGAIFFVNGADGGGIVRQLMGGLSDSIGAEALIAAPNGNIIVGNPNSNGAMGSVLLLDASASYATIATINGISSGERLGDSTIGSIDVFSRSAFGDFIINSPDRDAGGFAAAGGVILASTTDLGGGVILRGVISGAETQDRLGEDNTIQNLSNDDFIIFNANADDVGGSGGFDDQGAIILASAAGTELGRFYGQNFGEQLGLNGQVRETNSGNGNYYAVSDLASPGGVTDAGSVYLLDGTNGLLIGQADGDTANENFGSSFFDQFGLISSGSNDVRVFSSAGHSGGGTVVQLADVDLGGGNIIRGRVDGTVGLGNLENLGAFGSQITPDGMHYLLRSQNADAGGLVDAGTVYFVNISTGALTNQVDGISANENFGSFGNTSLSTFGGNIFATSESADVGPTMNAGHVMLLDSSGALIGDFFGNNTNEFLGSNFQFVGADIWTIAPQHNNGGQIAAGGIFAIANQDLGGANIVRNSLLGSRAGDNLGSLGASFNFTTGNYTIRVPLADVAGNVDAGTAIMVDSSLKEIGRTNGTSANELFSNIFFTTLANGNLLYRSPDADMNGLIDAGTLKLVSSTTGTLIGETAGTSAMERFGANFPVFLVNDGLAIVSSDADSGGLVDAGAIVQIDPNTGLELQRVVGISAGERLGSSGRTNLSAGRIAFGSPLADVDGVLGAGRILIFDPAGGTQGGEAMDLLFSDSPGGDFILTTGAIEAALNNGTNLILQANSDIIIQKGTVLNATGGFLTLQAGRSILVSGLLNLPGTGLKLIANESEENGVNLMYRGDGSGDFVLVDPQIVGKTIELSAEVVQLFGDNDPTSINTLQVSSELFENFLADGTLDGPASFVLALESLIVNANEIQLIGGDSPGAFAALASFGEFTVNADNILLQPGTAPGSHALLLGLGGLGEFNFNSCTGCGDSLLFSDPFLEDGPISGLFIAGLLQEPTIDAILAMLGQGDDENEDDDDEEVNECSI